MRRHRPNFAGAARAWTTPPPTTPRPSVICPPPPATAHLLNLTEGTDIGLAVNDAMRAIERDNPQMAGVLPKSYQLFNSRLLAELLKTISNIPSGVEGDAFGRIYEYFLGTFARSEGQKGGEFFTPLSLVGLIVEVVEPFCGRILDRASGSGGCSSKAPDSSARIGKIPPPSFPSTARSA